MAAEKSLLMLSGPHVHTQYCDGKSTAEAMARSAFRRGFVSLGFTSHAKQDFHQEYSLNVEREVEYIREVRRLQEAYAGRMRIWLGMERDLYSDADRNDFEYVLGSLHYVLSPQGDKLPVDASPDLLKRIVFEAYQGDALGLMADYYADYGEFIQSYKPDIIAHFDLPLKYNHLTGLFDTGSPRYIKAATDALDRAYTGCQLMEVNVGGMIRAGTSEPYPSLPLLKYWRAIGGQVILSADCHKASQMTAGYAAGIAHMRQAGYQKAAFLGRQDVLFEWADLP